MVDEMIALLTKMQADDDSKKEIVEEYATIFAWELTRPCVTAGICVCPEKFWATRAVQLER